MLAGGRGHGLGDSEIGDHCVAARCDYVLRFHIPVDHPFLMSIGQRVHDLAKNPYRLGHRQLPLPCEPLSEGLTLYVGHYVIEETSHLAGVDQR